MKGLYSGRQILALKTKGMKITRSQTAAQAEKAIIRKYGSISPGGKYFHLGKGNWKKYSLESDQTRTGRLAPDLKTWREAPHKWDREGVDTKKEGSEKKQKKQKFSISKLEQSRKLVGRRSKSQIKIAKAPIIKSINKPTKKKQRLHNPYSLPVKRISLNIPESKRETNRTRDRLYHNIKAYGIIDEIDNKAFLDKLSTKQILYIMDNYTDYQKPFPENPKFVYTVEEPKFKTSQLNTPKPRFKKRDSKKYIINNLKATTKTINKSSIQKKHVNHNKSSNIKHETTSKIPANVKPATFDLKNNPNRKEFISTYTGITGHIKKRTKRVENIIRDMDKGKYKNADTRKHEANHERYIKRGERLQNHFLKTEKIEKSVPYKNKTNENIKKYKNKIKQLDKVIASVETDKSKVSTQLNFKIADRRELDTIEGRKGIRNLNKKIAELDNAIKYYRNESFNYGLRIENYKKERANLVNILAGYGITA